LKDQLFFRLKIVLICFVPLLSLLSGCAATSSDPVTASSELDEYRSELDDPDAKALLAFSEFRMLGAQNRWDKATAALERALKFDPQSEYLQFTMAEAHLHRQQPAQAITILQKLENQTPDSVAVQQLLGDALSLQKKYLPAIDHFKRALQLDPDNSNTRLRLALALSRIERNDEALTILEDLVARHPDTSIAQLALARLYLRNHQSDKAATTYKQLIAQQPTAYQPVLEYGKMLEGHDVPSALELYRKFLEQSPRAAVVRQQLAQVYLTQNRRDDALIQLLLLRQQYPDNPRIAGQVGLIQLELEDWAAAEKEFRWLVNGTERDQNDYYYLAMALAAQEKTDEAIVALEELLDDMTSYPEAALQLAYLYQKSGQDTQAIILLEKMVAEGIHRSNLYYYLVAFFGDQKEYQQALDYALSGVEKNPDSSRLLYQLGVLYEKMTQRQKAIKTMEEVLRVDENHADALNFLAYDQAESGEDLPLALERAKKALAIKPSGFIVDTLGWIYYKMNRYDESRIQLEKATEMHPNDPVIAEHLGDLYRAMKLRDKAVAVYRRVLKMNPQAQQVQEKLDKLIKEIS